MTLRGGYALPPGSAIENLDLGGGSVVSLKVTGEQSRGTVTVLAGVMRSGGSPLHVHEAEDEVVMVVEGQLDYQLGEQRGTLAAGGMIWLPRQVPHTVANWGDRPCRFVIVVTPSGIEDLLRAQRDYVAGLPVGTPPDPARLAELPGAQERPVVGPPFTRS